MQQQLLYMLLNLLQNNETSKTSPPLYNFNDAIGAGYREDESGHWPSRVNVGENEGLILKNPKHGTFWKTMWNDFIRGYEFYEENGRLFSFQSNDPILYNPSRHFKKVNFGEKLE